MARNSCLMTNERVTESARSQNRPNDKLRVVAKSLAAESPSLGERRGEVLRGLFPKLVSWMETAAERLRRREIEDYLGQSTSLADLEERIRRLERQSSLSLYH